MTKLLLISLTIMYTGCSYNIDDISLDGKDKECIQKCKKIHQASITDVSETEFKIDIRRAAKYTYEICLSTC